MSFNSNLLTGVITHKQSSTEFHVKSLENCYHCKIRPLFRKRSKKMFFRPGDFVCFMVLQGWTYHGLICQKADMESSEVKKLLETKLEEGDHDCTLLKDGFSDL